MTRSGSIGLPRRCWPSWPDAPARIGWHWCSACASPARNANWWACPSSRSRRSPKGTPGWSWVQRSAAAWTTGCGTGILAEARGNPLALLQLPLGLTAAELAGGFGLPGAAAVASRIEHSFHRQVQALPDDTRQLLLTDTIRACPFGCGHLVAALSSVPCMATLSRRALHDSPYVPGPADPWERPVTYPGATQPLPTRP